MKVFSQLEKAQLENTTSDTGSLPKGMITYRTDLNIAKVSNGTSMLALIDESSTQTLSGKTYATPSFTGAFNMAQAATPSNPSAGNNKFYFKADGKLYTLDSSGNEALVGSGSGGVKNLITNGSADDTAASIFTSYQDSSGTRPSDGTGGTTTGITTSITSTTPLDGTKAFLLTKDAANRQGGGWAVPFTVDPAYRAKSLKISVDYIINSGTFVAGANGSSPVDSDVIWYIYDVTNSQLIEPSNIKMFSNNSSISDKFEATFQSSATGSSYRLIAHIASTSALAYELKVDNITVSPQSYVFGTPVTDWQSFTPTGSWVTNVGYAGYWRRIGDSMQVKILITASGAVTAANLTVNLPSGYVIDTTKLNSTAGSTGQNVGTGTVLDSGVNNYPLGVWVQSSTVVAPFVVNASGTYGAGAFVSNTVPFTVGNTDTLAFEFLVPIVGWSSSVQMSDSADTRVVAAHGYDTGSTIYNSNAARQQMPLDTALFDTHGMISGNIITIPVSGYYEIKGKALWSGANMSSGGTYELLVTTGSVGGTIVAADDQRCAAAGAFVTNNVNMTRYFTAGTTLYAVLTSSVNHSVSTVTIDGTAAHWSYLSVNRVTGPSAIAASEKVYVEYTNSAGTSITGSDAANILPFATKVKDSHGAWSTNVFTAPRSDWYSIKTHFNIVNMANATRVIVFLQKNSSNFRRLTSMRNSSGGSLTLPNISLTTSTFLNAGETLRINAIIDDATTRALEASGDVNWITIESQGGV